MTDDTDTDTEGGVALHDRVELRPLDSLDPYDQNPKAHPEKQVEKIATSIAEFGWDQPIVVDDGGEIIKGHGRLQAADRLGLEQVPVIERDDLDDAEIRAARLADNRASESFWDDGALADELAALDDLADDFELETTGFDPDELDDLLGEPTPQTDPSDTGDDGGGTSTGPQDGSFETVDDGDITLEHECPNCGYEW